MMIRFNFSTLLIITTAALLLSGCMATDSDYIIRVTTNPGMHFTGGYNVVSSSGQSAMKTVEGIGTGPTKPIDYSVHGNIVAATFQKSDDWEGQTTILYIEILKKGKVVASTSTAARYGVASIGTN